MADQNHSELLNHLLRRIYRGLLQYSVECWPWTQASESPDGKSGEQKAVEQMAASQQQLVARLVDLLVERGATVDLGNYPDYSEMHYVSLDYLLGKLIDGQVRLIAELEAAGPMLRDDPEAAGFVSDLLAAEREHLSRLRDLSRRAAAVLA